MVLNRSLEKLELEKTKKFFPFHRNIKLCVTEKLSRINYDKVRNQDTHSLIRLNSLSDFVCRRGYSLVTLSSPLPPPNAQQIPAHTYIE